MSNRKAFPIPQFAWAGVMLLAAGEPLKLRGTCVCLA